MTFVLRLTRQRERVFTWRVNRARRLRAAAAQEDPSVRPALHNMDTKLNAIIDRDNGFFVEAGANDGFTQSNTYWLERFRGWRGILVEPMPELYELCRQERPNATVIQSALVGFEYGARSVRMRFAELMSTVAGDHVDEGRTWMGTAMGWREPYEADVRALPLTELLDDLQAPEIDLLSLDVEGYEAEVLAGLDLQRHAPRWILVEIHDEAAGRPPIDAALGDRYVMHSRLSPLDYLYKRTS